MLTEKSHFLQKKDVASKKQIDLVKDIQITNKDKTTVFAELSKTIYIADKEFYKEKRRGKSKK